MRWRRWLALGFVITLAMAIHVAILAPEGSYLAPAAGLVAMASIFGIMAFRND